MNYDHDFLHAAHNLYLAAEYKPYTSFAPIEFYIKNSKVLTHIKNHSKGVKEKYRTVKCQ